MTQMMASNPPLEVAVFTGSDELVDRFPLGSPGDCPQWSWLADTVAEAHRLHPPPPLPYVVIHSGGRPLWQFESEHPRHLPPMGQVRHMIRQLSLSEEKTHD